MQTSGSNSSIKRLGESSHRSLSQLELDRALSQTDSNIIAMKDDETLLTIKKAAEAYVRKEGRRRSLVEEPSGIPIVRIDSPVDDSFPIIVEPPNVVRSREMNDDELSNPGRSQEALSADRTRSADAHLNSSFRQNIKPSSPFSLAVPLQMPSRNATPSLSQSQTFGNKHVANASSFTMNRGTPANSGAASDNASPNNNAKAHSISNFLDQLSNKNSGSDGAITSPLSQTEHAHSRVSSNFGSSPLLSTNDKSYDSVSASSHGLETMNFDFLIGTNKPPPYHHSESFAGYTFFGLLRPQHPFRIRLHSFISHRSYQIFLAILTVLHWSLLISYKWDYSKGRAAVFGSHIQDLLMVPIYVILSLDLLLFSIAYGFIPPNWLSSSEKGGRKRLKPYPAVLADSLRILDAIVVTSYWIFVIIEVKTGIGFKFLRALSSLRPIRLLWLTPGTSLMTRSVTASRKLVQNVMTFLLFFFAVFSAMGLQFFSQSLNRRCVVPQWGSHGEIVAFAKAEPIRSCNYINQTTYSNSVQKGYTCTSDQLCMLVSTIDEIPSGILNFDNIFSSFVTTFQTVSMQGWTDVMYQTMDSDYPISAFYHVSIIVILQLVIMSLLIAVVVQTYSVLHAEYKYQANERNKNKAKLLKSLVSEIDGSKKNSFPSSQSEYQLLKTIYNSRIYHALFLLMSFTSLFLLDNGFFDTSKLKNRVPYVAISFLLWLYFIVDFGLTTILKRDRRTPVYRDRVCIRDFSLHMVSLIIIMPSFTQTDIHRYLSLVLIARSYKVFGLIPGLRRILSTAFGNFIEIWNGFVFFVMVIAIVATCFMHLFGGGIDGLNSIAYSPNFNNFYWAFLATFQIMVSDQWTVVFYNGVMTQRDFIFGQVLCIVFFRLYLFFFTESSFLWPWPSFLTILS
eukprot:Partr_v1_DN28981_c0_g1_i2_m25126 putative Calcium channel